MKKILFPTFKYLCLFAAACGFGMLQACTSEDGPDKGGNDDDYEGVRSITLSANESKAISRLSDFNRRFFAEVNSKQASGDNIAVSPLSASMLLSLLANAADEECESQIIEVLGVDDIKSLNSASRKLIDELPLVAPKVKTTLANSVWFERGLILDENFAATARDSYCADLMSCDLADASDKTLREINGWASDKTQGLIPEFLEQMPEGIEAILLNALYFNGKWARTFDESSTHEGIFHGVAGDSRTQMMNKTERMLACGTEGYTAVIKPFAGHRYEALFILPDEGSDINALIESTAPGNIAAQDFKYYNVDFTMPIFEFQPKTAYNLTNIFADMGVESIGKPQNMRIFSPRKELKCKIEQKTAVKFTEQGAEAAAVTGTTMDTAIQPEGRLTLTLDRPFIFYINESSSGVCLFAGKIVVL